MSIPSEMKPPGTDTPTPTVLVVENNAEVLRLMAEMVSSQDWHPVPSSTLKEARAHLRDHTVQAIITDYELEDGTALDLLAELTESGPLDIPTVVVSSYASQEIREKVRRAGAIDLLPKPFRLEQLANILSDKLDRTGIKQQ